MRAGGQLHVTPPEIAADPWRLKSAIYDEIMARSEKVRPPRRNFSEKHKKPFMAEGKDERSATRPCREKGDYTRAAQPMRNADGYDNERPLV